MEHWVPIIVIALALGFWAYCIVDFMQTPTGKIRSLSQPVWLFILVFGSVVGGLAWWSLGRPNHPTHH